MSSDVDNFIAEEMALYQTIIRLNNKNLLEWKQYPGDFADPSPYFVAVYNKVEIFLTNKSIDVRSPTAAHTLLFLLEPPPMYKTRLAHWKQRKREDQANYGIPERRRR